MTDKITILCATDNNYVPWCGIMLTSILENNRNNIGTIYILTAGLNPEKHQALSRLSDKYNVCVNILTINEDLLKDFHVREGHCITVATWYRILAPAVLPDTVEKVLYLDCDIIVNGSLSTLWEINLDQYAIGAVPDESSFQDEYYKRLSFPKDSVYFNAGVLLMNLKYWRKNDVMQRCIDYIRASRDILDFYDQDTLNKVLYKEKLLLPVTWNLQNGFLWSWQIGCYDSDLQNAIKVHSKNPRIIHYSGPSKPWSKGCYHPFTPFFLYYRSISEWKGAPLIGHISIKDRISRLSHWIAVRLGWSRPLYILPVQHIHHKTIH